MTLAPQPDKPEVGSALWWTDRVKAAGSTRPKLSRESIGEAALRVVDTDGLDALSMRRLGAELETSPASLYRHFSSKEELIVELVDLLLGSLEPQTPLGSDDWREEAGYFARSLRTGILAHPEVAPLIGKGHMLGPNALARREAGLRFFIRVGFPPAEAAAAYLSIVHFVFGFVLQEVGQFFRSPSQRRHLGEFFDSLSDEQYPTIKALADEMCGLTTESEFEFALEALLTGIYARVGRSGRTGTPDKRAEANGSTADNPAGGRTD